MADDGSFRIQLDPLVPPGEVHFRMGDRLVLRIINVGVPEMSDDLVGVYHGGVELDEDVHDAVLFKCLVGKTETDVWIPRSQLEDYDEEHMVIPRWLADDRDLEPDWEL